MTTTTPLLPERPYAPILADLAPVSREDFCLVLKLRREFSIDYPDSNRNPPAVNLNAKWQKHDAGIVLYPEDIDKYEHGRGRFDPIQGPFNTARNTLARNYERNNLTRILQSGGVEAPGPARGTQKLTTLGSLERGNARAPLDPILRVTNPLEGVNSRIPFDLNLRVPSDPNLRTPFDPNLRAPFDPNPRVTHALEGGHSRAPNPRVAHPLEGGNTRAPFDRSPSITSNPAQDAARAELSDRGGGGTANASAHAIPAPPGGIRAPALALPAPAQEPWFLAPVIGPTTRAQWLQEHPPTPPQSQIAQAGASSIVPGHHIHVTQPLPGPATQRGYLAPPANGHYFRANPGSIVHAMPGSINRAYYGTIADDVPGSIPYPTLGPIPHSIPRSIASAATGPVAQATSGSVFDAARGSINQAIQPTRASGPKKVTKYPALMVLSDVMKVKKVSLDTDIVVKFNAHLHRLTVLRNGAEMFRVKNLNVSTPTKLAHSSTLQMFYVELQSTGENEEPSAILFKMAIPRDESETHAKFRFIFTSKLPKEGNNVRERDDAYFSTKATQLEHLSALGARRDRRVDALLTPKPRFQTPRAGPSGGQYLGVNVVEKQIYKSPHRVVSAKKVTAKPGAVGPEHVPVQVRPNDGHLQERTIASVGVGSGTVYVEKSSADGGAGIAMSEDGVTITNDNDNLPAHSETVAIAKTPDPIEKPQWQRKERDGCTYKIMCTVRAEVNDIVIWVRDKSSGSIAQLLAGMDGPFKILEVSTEFMACRLAVPEDSKVKQAWIPVDQLNPVRLISDAETVVIAQDTGAMPIPINGILKLTDKTWLDVTYYPTSDPHVEQRRIFRVLGRRVVGPGDTPIVPNSKQAFDANIPKRAQYLVGFMYHPSDDNQWLSGSSVPPALLDQYNAKNPVVSGSVANVIPAWPDVEANNGAT